MRDAHEQELQVYAQNVQNERSRQRERMRKRLEAKRKARSSQATATASVSATATVSATAPAPPRSNDAYLGAKESSALAASNDAFKKLMMM